MPLVRSSSCAGRAGCSWIPFILRRPCMHVLLHSIPHCRQPPTCPILIIVPCAARPFLARLSVPLGSPQEAPFSFHRPCLGGCHPSLTLCHLARVLCNIYPLSPPGKAPQPVSAVGLKGCDGSTGVEGSALIVRHGAPEPWVVPHRSSRPFTAHRSQPAVLHHAPPSVCPRDRRVRSAGNRARRRAA